MFNSVQDAIEWISSRKKHLHPYSDFVNFMAYHGNPQYELKCIHVAGTNGKGSTTNYLRSMLQTAGYKTGSFTSPHLLTHLDRIRVNDENIDEDFFLQAINQYQNEFIEYDLTMFEIDMFISVLYFLAQKVDYVVYEVGLGGRLDATNVIKPLVAVITNIELDHMQILGDTIGKIAYEKAGIIKKHVDVLTFEKKKEALDVFMARTKQEESQLYLTQQATNIIITDKITFDYHNHHVTLPSSAPYQILNAQVALDTIDYLKANKEIDISEQQIVEGMNTIWAGRFEVVRQKPKIILDGAHNENGIDALCIAIESLNEEVIIVFSALKDKKYHEMLAKLVQKGKVIVTEFESERSQSAINLANGFDVDVIEDYKQAIEYAKTFNKTIIITGSLYFISCVRTLFV